MAKSKNTRSTKNNPGPTKNTPPAKDPNKDGISKVMQSATLPDGSVCDFPMYQARIGETEKVFADRKECVKWYKEQRALYRKFWADTMIQKFFDRIEKLEESQIPAWRTKELEGIKVALAYYLTAEPTPAAK